MAFQASVLLLFLFEILRCSEKYFVAPNDVMRIRYNVETFNEALLMSHDAKMSSDLSIANLLIQQHFSMYFAK